MSGHELLLNIGGGVALLLWATRMVRTGILRAFGTGMRRWLERSSRNWLAAFGIGLGITAILQSSTATALLAMSFAGRGLLAVAPALAAMLGADVGSTLVAQILSFDITWLSPVLILAGVVAFMASAATRSRQAGRILIGLGLMLLSLRLIVAATGPLRGSAGLQNILSPLAADPILAVLLAAALTWLAHSSVAMILLIMSLVAVQVIPLALGFALVLGANIGAGLVPFFLSLNSDPLSRRIPLGNLLFRAAGVLAALPLIGLIAPYLAALDDAPARQIANFHSAFNLALAMFCLPLVGGMAALTGRLLPLRHDAEASSDQPRYLDETAIDAPPVALACATRETMRMADVVEAMLRDTIEAFRTDDESLLARIGKLDDTVDSLHEAIKLYLMQVSRNVLDEADSRRCIDMIAFTTNLEHIGDIIDKSLLELAQKKIRHRQQFSAQGWRELTDLHARVLRNMQLAVSVFVSGDIETARRLVAEKDRFRELGREAEELHLQRLREGHVPSIATSAIHLDVLRDLKQVNSHLAAVAYPILDASGELRRSRLKPPGGEPQP